jgi:protein TonB
MITTRFIIGVPVAAAITFGLFVLMRGMIAGGDEIEQIVYQEAGVIIIGRTKTDSDTKENEFEIEELPEEDAERPDPPAPSPDDAETENEMGGLGQERLPPDIGNPGRDVCGQPVVRIAPTYPRRAAEQGIEGYAVVQFTVTLEGMVKDAVVVEQEPGTVFGSAAKRAVEKWRYAPCKVNGEVREVRLEVRLTFELADS